MSETYTAEEVARMLGLSLDAVYDGRRRGEIPGLKIGNRVLFPRRRFDAWLNGEPAADVESPAMRH